MGDCFESALKAWRIYRPTLIRAEHANLTDAHIELLCEFLAGREMVSALNLRRNMIGNQGAKCLAKFMSESDSTLTHLDLTRNRIGQVGGQAMLDALNATTRIVDCQMKYGNPLSNKLGRVIEREVKANLQAVSYAAEHGEKGVLKYELVDKGPDFMRCAIKMAQLHDILHLSLPPSPDRLRISPRSSVGSPPGAPGAPPQEVLWGASAGVCAQVVLTCVYN